MRGYDNNQKSKLVALKYIASQHVSVIIYVTLDDLDIINIRSKSQKEKIMLLKSYSEIIVKPLVVKERGVSRIAISRV